MFKSKKTPRMWAVFQDGTPIAIENVRADQVRTYTKQLVEFYLDGRLVASFWGVREIREVGQ